MKNANKTKVMGCGLAILFGVIVYLWYNPKTVEVEVPVRVPVRTRARTHTRAPEYREAPIKRYKPGHMQQMGLLVGEGEETLPLYGKEVRGRRDQYHYYTTTGGDNLYPLPIRRGDRDCMDDIGCQELYGNESVSVLGKEGPFNVKMYRTDDFF